MAGNLFDVFVVGSTDPSPAGETRLAAALSSKHGVPLATVSKAISGKNLRAGQALDQAQAQALVRQLQGIGAVTVIRPAGASGRPNTQSHLPPQATPQPPRGPSPTPPSPAFSPLTPSPLATDNAAAFGPPLGTGGNAKATHAGTAFPSPRPSTMAPNASAFEPPRGNTPLITRARPIGTPMPGTKTAMEDGGMAEPPGPRLELARGDKGGSNDELSGLRKLPTQASAANLREVGVQGGSGVGMDADPKNLNLVRCAQHGLYYDKTKSSGCRKCLAQAREQAGSFEARNAEVRVGGDLRKKPMNRAFLGLGFALFIGLLPASYYAFGPGASAAKQCRVEQEILSRQPGTEEILQRFDELDTQVVAHRDRALRNTAIVWLAVAGIAMAGWYKIT